MIVEVPISVVYAEKAKRNPVAHGLQIVENIIKLVGMHRPLFFFGIQGLLMLMAGGFLAVITTNIYMTTRQLALGYALIAIMLLMLGVMAIFVGLILHSVRSSFMELKKLMLANRVVTEQD